MNRTPPEVAAARRERVAELYRANATYREIMATLDMKHHTVVSDVLILKAAGRITPRAVRYPGATCIIEGCAEPRHHYADGKVDTCCHAHRLERERNRSRERKANVIALPVRTVRVCEAYADWGWKQALTPLFLGADWVISMELVGTLYPCETCFALTLADGSERCVGADELLTLGKAAKEFTQEYEGL